MTGGRGQPSLHAPVALSLELVGVQRRPKFLEKLNGRKRHDQVFVNALQDVEVSHSWWRGPGHQAYRWRRAGKS